MSVNGVTNYGSSSTAYTGYTKNTNSAKDSEAAAEKSSTGVIYEKSTDTKSASKSQRAEIISKLKADADAKASQMRSLVEKMMGKQGVAIGNSDSMWKFLAGGNFSVDPATRAQAQADIAEDGYWGVTQTSDRILDFAKALAGNDSDKMDEMLSAFKKGFKQATKTWGKSLPDISQRTYDAVLSKFEQWQNDYAGTTKL